MEWRSDGSGELTPLDNKRHCGRSSVSRPKREPSDERDLDSLIWAQLPSSFASTYDRLKPSALPPLVLAFIMSSSNKPNALRFFFW